MWLALVCNSSVIVKRSRRIFHLVYQQAHELNFQCNTALILRRNYKVRETKCALIGAVYNNRTIIRAVQSFSISFYLVTEGLRIYKTNVCSPLTFDVNCGPTLQNSLM